MGICRQALRYIIRNTTLPTRTRAEAQLQLTQMHCYTRPTQIRNRCILGGKSRGILRDFKMSRVSFSIALSTSVFLGDQTRFGESGQEKCGSGAEDMERRPGL